MQTAIIHSFFTSQLNTIIGKDLYFVLGNEEK